MKKFLDKVGIYMDERLFLYVLATILSTVGFFYLYREAKERKKFLKKEKEKEEAKNLARGKQKGK